MYTATSTPVAQGVSFNLGFFIKSQVNLEGKRMGELVRSDTGWSWGFLATVVFSLLSTLQDNWGSVSVSMLSCDCQTCNGSVDFWTSVLTPQQ